MIKEFKSNKSQFNTYIGVSIFAIIVTIILYAVLNMVMMILPVFAIFWTIIAFWGKDRVLITLHEDYLEVKEAIAAKKKLIRYTNIDRIELHKTGKQLTVYLKDNSNKKEKIALGFIEKEDRKEFVELLNNKIIA
jgi:hypothetical protein